MLRKRSKKQVYEISPKRYQFERGYVLSGLESYGFIICQKD
jgi:hypothetical protein